MEGRRRGRRSNQSGRIDNSCSSNARYVTSIEIIGSSLFLGYCTAYLHSLSLIVDYFRTRIPDKMEERWRNAYLEILIYVRDRSSTERNISLILFSLNPSANSTTRYWFGMRSLSKLTLLRRSIYYIAQYESMLHRNRIIVLSIYYIDSTNAIFVKICILN